MEPIRRTEATAQRQPPATHQLGAREDVPSVLGAQQGLALLLH
jgi:hypothetical protein